MAPLPAVLLISFLTYGHCRLPSSDGYVLPPMDTADAEHPPSDKSPPPNDEPSYSSLDHLQSDSQQQQSDGLPRNPEMPIAPGINPATTRRPPATYRRPPPPRPTPRLANRARLGVRPAPVRAVVRYNPPRSAPQPSGELNLPLGNRLPTVTLPTIPPVSLPPIRNPNVLRRGRLPSWRTVTLPAIPPASPPSVQIPNILSGRRPQPASPVRRPVSAAVRRPQPTTVTRPQQPAARGSQSTTIRRPQPTPTKPQTIPGPRQTTPPPCLYYNDGRGNFVYSCVTNTMSSFGSSNSQNRANTVNSASSSFTSSSTGDDLQVNDLQVNDPTNRGQGRANPPQTVCFLMNPGLLQLSDSPSAASSAPSPPSTPPPSSLAAPAPSNTSAMNPPSNPSSGLAPPANESANPDDHSKPWSSGGTNSIQADSLAGSVPGPYRHRRRRVIY